MSDTDEILYRFGNLKFSIMRLTEGIQYIRLKNVETWSFPSKIYVGWYTVGVAKKYKKIRSPSH